MDTRVKRAWVCGWILCALGAGIGRAAEEVIAVTTDFGTGSITTLGTAPPWPPEIDRASICPDAVARSYANRVYVVNRFGCDNIQVLDPWNGFATLREFTVGSGSNPQDIAPITPNRAYVTRYASTWLLEVNPETGALTDSISLAPFADVDGLPEMHRMLAVGTYLFIELQRLDTREFPYVPVVPSMLAVVDVTTGELVDCEPAQPGVQAIALQGTNPAAPMQVDLVTGDILVPEAGMYGVMTDGGIERVDPVMLESAGFALSGPAMNGDLVDFCQWSGAVAYLVLSDAAFNTSLVRWNPSTGTRGANVYAPGGYLLSDCMTHPGGYLYLTDRDFFDPGVRVFDAQTGALLSGGVIPTGLPPFELIARPDYPSSVDGPVGLVDGNPWPNPSCGDVQIAWRAGSGEEMTVRLVAPDGREVRRWIAWGTRFRASDLSEGAYWLVVESPAGLREARPIRVLR